MTSKAALPSTAANWHARTGIEPMTALGEIPWRELRPYFSVVVLEYTGESPHLACQQIIRALQSGRLHSADSKGIVAGGIATPGERLNGELGGSDFSEARGFIHRVLRPPPWHGPDSSYVNTTYHLTVVLRRRSLVIVRADDSLQDRLQRWLDKAPRPAFRRIPDQVLEHCLLQGETKGMWLRGTHSRRSTKPDTKNLSGLRLQDALNPHEDASYTLSSARSTLPEGTGRRAFVGTAGTSTKKSSVWLSTTDDWPHFLAIAKELLDLLEPALADPSPESAVFSVLAREVRDLTQVRGAFDLYALAAEELPATPDSGADVRDAAATLERAILDVRGDPTSAHFELDVGLDGAVTGTLGAQLKETPDGFTIEFELHDETSFLSPTRQILDALSYPQLITVHYRSGHTFVDGRICTRNTTIAPFPHWKFEDFSGYDITREKPEGNPQELHDKIATTGDDSLFGWVARHFAPGSLTCDDGPGEIADFVHIDPAGVLSMIHVKAAKSSSSKRGIAASAYEVVTGQATKNLIYADVDRLRARLLNSPVTLPATWENGVRCTSRHEFMESVQLRDIGAPVQTVIVQPHVPEHVYRRRRKEADGKSADPSDEFLRLCHLETMLNAARTAAVGLAAELVVISSRV